MSFRDGPFQDLRVPLAWTAAVATIVAGVVALALVLDDHRANAHGQVANGNGARSQFDESIAPVSSLFAAPLRWTSDAGAYIRDYFNAVDENRRLKAEVAELQRYRDVAFALKNVNLRYEALLKLRTEPAAPMVTARVVADARGPFSHARLADVGAAEGVTVGNPVLSEHGVVGRVVGVSKNSSRVLLLTDVDSRLPVLVNSTNARAILSGDGGDTPKLQYLRGHDPIRKGDIILTSGDGGLYPRGLPVGVADQDLFGQWRVKLYSDRSAIDYVRIMKFTDFSQLVDEAALANHAVPPVTAAEKAQIEAAVAARLSVPRPDAAKADAAKTETGKGNTAARHTDARDKSPPTGAGAGKTSGTHAVHPAGNPR